MDYKIKKNREIDEKYEKLKDRDDRNQCIYCHRVF
jgi:hypothetical protein